MTILLPRTAFHERLKEAFNRNNCDSCVINIYACTYMRNILKVITNRKQIGEETGCAVYAPHPNQGGVSPIGFLAHGRPLNTAGGSGNYYSYCPPTDDCWGNKGPPSMIQWYPQVTFPLPSPYYIP